MTTLASTKRRICLFGLSADPPTGTGGHGGIVQTLSSLATGTDGGLDEIRVLPVYRHTYAVKRTRLATYQDRLAMCRIAFAGIPRTVVSNDEYQSWCRKVEEVTSEEARAQVSVGTAALLEYLHQQDDSQHMEHEYTFCLGADAFLDLTADKWKESERVLQLLQGRFLVLHRVDSERENGQGEVSAIELRDRVAAVPGATLVSVPSLGAVSSSRVRDAVDAGEWASLKDEHVMHPQVLDYIRQQGLYTST